MENPRDSAIRNSNIDHIVIRTTGHPLYHLDPLDAEAADETSVTPSDWNETTKKKELE